MESRRGEWSGFNLNSIHPTSESPSQCVRACVRVTTFARSTRPGKHVESSHSFGAGARKTGRKRAMRRKITERTTHAHVRRVWDSIGRLRFQPPLIYGHPLFNYFNSHQPFFPLLLLRDLYCMLVKATSWILYSRFKSINKSITLNIKCYP